MPFGPTTCEILAHTHIYMYTRLTADVRLVQIVVNSVILHLMLLVGERHCQSQHTMQENRDPGQGLTKDHVI